MSEKKSIFRKVKDWWKGLSEDTRAGIKSTAVGVAAGIVMYEVISKQGYVNGYNDGFAEAQKETTEKAEILMDATFNVGKLAGERAVYKEFAERKDDNHGSQKT